ncbi:tetratricopeptide repeat protein [Leptothermofonsia sp. ETS-13]|uniref:tetratricopeptide repeat protein n=1 Tax=Leptothermofonsia sp. ETS-13 TaxID=3035696 RepID=UPI003B9F83CD
MTERYELAIAHFQKTLELQSDFPNAHYSLGLTYYLMGNYREARKATSMPI